MEKNEIDDTIVIVSGLPRSGTSMVMKMLQAGGLEVVKDDIRKADEDNPGGYYEFEEVKKIKSDPAWLQSAKGKSVKMVSMLLYDLPDSEKYKIIFMNRKMEEILTSQRIMLERLGRTEEISDDAQMAKLFNSHLKDIKHWLKSRNNFSILELSYNDIIKNPAKGSAIIDEFLGQKLNAEKMSNIVTDSLYRQRK